MNTIIIAYMWAWVFPAAVKGVVAMAVACTSPDAGDGSGVYPPNP